MAENYKNCKLSVYSLLVIFLFGECWYLLYIIFWGNLIISLKNNHGNLFIFPREIFCQVCHINYFTYMGLNPPARKLSSMSKKGFKRVEIFYKRLYNCLKTAENILVTNFAKHTISFSVVDCILFIMFLTNFRRLVSFYAPWKYKKLLVSCCFQGLWSGLVAWNRLICSVFDFQPN